MADADSSPSKQQLVALYRQAVLGRVNLEVVDQTVQEQLESLKEGEQSDDQSLVVDARKVGRLPPLIQFGALIIPTICILLGTFLVGSAALPIAVAYFDGKAVEPELLAPIPEDQVLALTPLVISQDRTHEADSLAKPPPKLLDMDLDYTNLSNWFPSGNAPTAFKSASASAAVLEYTIDIPKLNIKNAQVAVGGTDLNKGLIAYEGTAAPGEYGAPVIFGHSVLRQFYNPSEKNPRRYNSIFSTIMTLKTGDEIYVTSNKTKFTYIVQEKNEVKPTDVYILNQKYDSKSLKLVTCTPEGTYLRRGVVTAQLVNQEGV